MSNPRIFFNDNPFGGGIEIKPEETKSVSQANTGSQVLQFVGGTVAAAKYVLTGSPLVKRQDIEYKNSIRKKFNDELEKLKNDPDVQRSPEARYNLGMIEGQNKAQTLLDQPMPEETVELFVKQVRDHAELDKVTRQTKDQPTASPKKHARIDIKAHAELSETFGKNGYQSGKNLHGIGGVFSTLQEAQYTKMPKDQEKELLEIVKSYGNK